MSRKKKSNKQKREIYSDATLTQGAWVNDQGTSMHFILPDRFQGDMFHAETYAAYRAIVDNGRNDDHIDLRCDNKGVCLMLNSRTAKHPMRYPHVSGLLTRLLSWMKSRRISLVVSWIPSECNLADGPSRSA
jgi:hypothetical protein